MGVVIAFKQPARQLCHGIRHHERRVVRHTRLQVGPAREALDAEAAVTKEARLTTLPAGAVRCPIPS